MATIEERARKASYDNLDRLSPAYEEGYIKGAIEQQSIDIDKACEWLNTNWRKYIDTDADGMIRFSGWENDFRKAMSEQP